MPATTIFQLDPAHVEHHSLHHILKKRPCIHPGYRSMQSLVRTRISIPI